MNLADVIYTAVRKVVREELGNVTSPFVYATFVASESVDANLSEVQSSDGTTSRFVPKLAQVTGLVAGDSLICIRGKNVPLTIIGKPVGDITLASVAPETLDGPGE